ncbi:MAG: metallophosphoesterase [Planctomycetota bacterium]
MNPKYKVFLLFVVFCLLLSFCVAAAPPVECAWSGVDRIVAVGDVHGDYDQLVKVLRLAEVIDDKNVWIGGKTHLVQTGDVLDRGPDSKKAMDLLMELETQAAAAGGFVHALMGNHEAMVPLGMLQYVHPGEFEAFGGREGLLKALSPQGDYGKWIAGHNVAIRINDILFLHGGMSPEYAKKPLPELNDAARQEFREGKEVKDGILMGLNGPLWCRDYAVKEEAALIPDLDAVFKAYSVSRMVVGHTVSKSGIQTRCNGRVVMIDVGLSATYGGPAQCLLVEKGVFYVVASKVKKELFPQTPPEAKTPKAD